MIQNESISLVHLGTEHVTSQRATALAVSGHLHRRISVKALATLLAEIPATRLLLRFEGNERLSER